VGIAFEVTVFHLKRGDLLDIVDHLNVERYDIRASSPFDSRNTRNLVQFA
jgi:hypothetical protein